MSFCDGMQNNGHGQLEPVEHRGGAAIGQLRCVDCGERLPEHRIGCKVLERTIDARDAARQEQLERIRARQSIATVQGHLEGYASHIANVAPACFSPMVDQHELIIALREDAATLAAVLILPEQSDQPGEGTS